MDKAWVITQADRIELALSHKHGNGWRLLSAEQRRNARAAEVLSLLLSQAMGKYEPAQAFVAALMNDLEADDG